MFMELLGLVLTPVGLEQVYAAEVCVCVCVGAGAPCWQMDLDLLRKQGRALPPG